LSLARAGDVRPGPLVLAPVRIPAATKRGTVREPCTTLDLCSGSAVTTGSRLTRRPPATKRSAAMPKGLPRRRREAAVRAWRRRPLPWRAAEGSAPRRTGRRPV